MKNQALITTLAVLLAVALSAIVAIVVTSDVLDAQTAGSTADTPTAIQIDVRTPNTGSAPAAGTPADAAQPAAPGQNNQANNAPAAPATPNTGQTGDTPAAPATPDTATPDTGDAQPGDTPDTPTAPDTDPDDDGDEPTLGEPPCDGTIVDGDCVTVPIACLIGYEWDGTECVFVACPFGLVLQDGVCEQLVLTLPCSNGYIRLQNGTCVLDAVILVPDVDLILCGPGLKLVDGECVTVCPPKHTWTAGFCVPKIELDLDALALPNVDLSAVNGN